MDNFELEKVIWTEKDYEQMGWHDCNIYGLIFQYSTNENVTTDLIFDIDYIFNWVHPIPPKHNFSFWVSPCTLIFEDTFALTMEIDRRGGMADMLEIADLYLVGKIEQEPNKWIYEWNIELQEGKITFKSNGFKQIVRQKPILTESQVLTLEERKGISFAPKAFNEMKKCEECKSEYFSNTSQMKNLCPECSHILYGYENCVHLFQNNRCIHCYWNGNTTEYIEKLKQKKKDS